MGSDMTANRHSGVSVSGVLDHLRGFFTEVENSALENFAPDCSSSQWLHFIPVGVVGNGMEVAQWLTG